MQLLARSFRCTILTLVVGCSGTPAANNEPAPTASQGVTSPAHARTCTEKNRTFRGDQAKAMIEALMLAGVSPSTHTGSNEAYTDTYTLRDIACQEGHFADDGISRYGCTNPDTHSEGARAKVLYDAMHSWKIAFDGGLGHIYAGLSKLNCVLDVPASAPVTYTCTARGLWANECDE